MASAAKVNDALFIQNFHKAVGWGHGRFQTVRIAAMAVVASEPGLLVKVPLPEADRSRFPLIKGTVTGNA
jgi:hypothetical protein